MKKNHYPLFFLFVIMTAQLLAGCSTDEGGSDSGGIGGSGIISTGAVTDVGSIWINGRHFDTRDAEVYVEDVYAGSGDGAIAQWIEPGQVVRVNGQSTTSGDMAQRVYFAPLVVGAIQEIEIIDSTTCRLTVLEQAIIIDQDTHLNNISIRTAAIGNVIEISGFLDETGNVRATFVKKVLNAAQSDTQFRLTGTISNLDRQSKTFYINDQVVNYHQIDPADVEDLVDDQMVVLTGRLDYSGTVFDASTIGAFSRVGDVDCEQVEIEGIVNTELQNDLFILDDQQVQITEDTEFVGGESADLLAGTRIEVEGRCAAGALLVSKIKFSAIFKAESNLFEFNNDNLTYTLIGLEGLTIQTNSLTRFQGLLNSGGFEQLETGRHLVVSGRHVDDTHVLASRIIGLPEVRNKALFRAMIQSIVGGRVTLSGVAFDTAEIADGGFFLEDGASVSRIEFINAIVEGDWVTVRGELTNDQSVAWDTMALTTTDE